MEPLHPKQEMLLKGRPIAEVDNSEKIIVNIEVATSEEKVVISSLTITASDIVKQTLL